MIHMYYSHVLFTCIIHMYYSQAVAPRDGAVDRDGERETDGATKAFGKLPTVGGSAPATCPRHQSSRLSSTTTTTSPTASGMQPAAPAGS